MLDLLRKIITLFEIYNMETLGRTLKSIREKVSLTLREVEESTGISNAYLSQLENDKIKKPSASVLYKLADVYKVDLNVLLMAAGIIETNPNANPDVSELEREIAFYKDKFSPEEEKKIIEFIKYLWFTNKNGAPTV
jgi:transcriptional regulator with XRE-family HTH domain